MVEVNNPYVVVKYGGGRPPHIYKIRGESEDGIDIVCSDMDKQIFERLDNCYDRFPTIVDAIEDITRGDGHNIVGLVGEYSLLFPAGKDSLENFFNKK